MNIMDMTRITVVEYAGLNGSKPPMLEMLKVTNVAENDFQALSKTGNCARSGKYES